MVALAMALLLLAVVAAIWIARTEDHSRRGFHRPRPRSAGQKPTRVIDETSRQAAARCLRPEKRREPIHNDETILKQRQNLRSGDPARPKPAARRPRRSSNAGGRSGNITGSRRIRRAGRFQARQSSPKLGSVRNPHGSDQGRSDQAPTDRGGLFCGPCRPFFAQTTVQARRSSPSLAGSETISSLRWDRTGRSGPARTRSGRLPAAHGLPSAPA